MKKGGIFIKIDNVYIADVYMLSKKYHKGNNVFVMSFESYYVKTVIVYKRKENLKEEYVNLINKEKYTNLNYFMEVGSKFINSESLISARKYFEDVTKSRVFKRKLIKKLLPEADKQAKIKRKI